MLFKRLWLFMLFSLIKTFFVFVFYNTMQKQVVTKMNYKPPRLLICDKKKFSMALCWGHKSHWWNFSKMQKQSFIYVSAVLCDLSDRWCYSSTRVRILVCKSGITMNCQNICLSSLSTQHPREGIPQNSFSSSFHVICHTMGTLPKEAFSDACWSFLSVQFTQNAG